jgi:flagellar protein FlaI
MRDPQIEDISCDGVGIPTFIFHRDPEIGSVVTNVKWETADELDSFITRLAQMCGKSISVATPLVDASLPDGSRVQATLATDIARKGSNFTIRKFTKEPMTPIHMLNYGTVDVRTLAYLWYLVDQGRSFLISGGTATGKTVFLNVLSLFIRPEKKIVSIEDTAEIRLPHPHWVPMVARVPIAPEVGKEVDLYALLRESLRMRPDYIIVGEVRGPEAYILFQQIATGHPSLATIHSEDMPKLIDRLTTPPISLPPPLIASLDVILFFARMTYKGRFVRRLVEVLEMREFDPKTKRPIVNPVFRWNPRTDRHDVVGPSLVLQKIADLTGQSESEIREEIERRALVLNWMWEQGITHYEDVYRVITEYYSDPRRVLAAAMR